MKNNVILSGHIAYCICVSALVAFSGCVSSQRNHPQGSMVSTEGMPGQKIDRRKELERSGIESDIRILRPPENIETMPERELLQFAGNAFIKYMTLGLPQATDEQEKSIQSKLDCAISYAEKSFYNTVTLNDLESVRLCRLSLYKLYGIMDGKLSNGAAANGVDVFFDTNAQRYHAAILYMAYNYAVSFSAKSIRVFLSSRSLKLPTTKLDAIIYVSVSDCINEHESEIRLYIEDFAPFLNSINPVCRLLAVEGIYECDLDPKEQSSSTDIKSDLVDKRIKLYRETVQEHEPIILDVIVGNLVAIGTPASLEVLKEAKLYHVHRGAESVVLKINRAIETLTQRLEKKDSPNAIR